MKVIHVNLHLGEPDNLYTETAEDGTSNTWNLRLCGDKVRQELKERLMLLREGFEIVSFRQ
jgi:hypothetical protein